MIETLSAAGLFTVQMQPLGEPDLVDGVALGRVKLSKQFDGQLVGSGEGEMLTALTSDPGSAGYVAIERVTGALNGRKGSFVLQHSGVMDAGARALRIHIVPHSGTGELAGIAGEFVLRIEAGQHHYTLNYRLPVL